MRAWPGQAVRQRRQLWQVRVQGAEGVKAAVVIISAKNMPAPMSGTMSWWFRPMKPTPARTDQ